MHKGRLEAFSDGVIAIIITIMVLELKVPHGADLEALRPLGPVFVSYVLSFIYIGIYWNNHHHMLQAVQKVSGGILWANNHLLFWLSLIPFTTAWMGEHEFAQWPVLVYGVNLLMCAVAYTILSRALIKQHGPDSLLARATGNDFRIYFAGFLRGRNRSDLCRSVDFLRVLYHRGRHLARAGSPNRKASGLIYAKPLLQEVT